MVKDSDRDDIPDDLDKCPLEPEDKDGFQDDDGCPDPDNDKDGIPDAQDKCPNDPETKNGIDDEDGCPEDDKDGDGIVGSKDKCPDQPEDKDGFQDEDGCPDPDNDKDGVADAQDKCPNEPETKNGFQDEDGCPDQIPAAVAKFTGVITGINFRQNSADIAKSSFPTLKKAVQVLKDYPALRIEISGHTSNEGKRDVNMKLSKDRAESVKAYLVSAGIEEGGSRRLDTAPTNPSPTTRPRRARSRIGASSSAWCQGRGSRQLGGGAGAQTDGPCRHRDGRTRTEGRDLARGHQEARHRRRHHGAGRGTGQGIASPAGPAGVSTWPAKERPGSRAGTDGGVRGPPPSVADRDSDRSRRTLPAGR